MTEQLPINNEQHDERHDQYEPTIEIPLTAADASEDWTRVTTPTARDLAPMAQHARGVLPAPDTALIPAVQPTEQTQRSGASQDRADWRGRRRLRAGGARLAFLVPAAISVLIVGGVIAVVAEPSWFDSFRNQQIPPPATISTTTSTPQQASGSTPRLSALQPDHASPGQKITVAGSGIISSNGSIAAYFGNQIASTRCPSESTCTVIVPIRPSGTSVVQLRLRTAAGYSNAMPFRFS